MAGDELAEDVIQAEQGRRIGGGKPQCIRQPTPSRRTQFATALAMSRTLRRAVHPAFRSGHSGGDRLSVEAEAGSPSANGRHRISYQDGVAAAAERKPEHGGVDMHPIHDQSIPCIGGLQCFGDRSGLTAGQRRHGIEEVGKGVEPFGHAAPVCS